MRKLDKQARHNRICAGGGLDKIDKEAITENVGDIGKGCLTFF